MPGMLGFVLIQLASLKACAARTSAVVKRQAKSSPLQQMIRVVMLFVYFTTPQGAN